MKQKLMAILLVLCMVVALVPAIAVTSTAANTSAGAVTDGTLPEDAEVLTGTASSFSGGGGSANDPYQIRDVTEFRYFQSLLLGDNKAEYLTKSYILTGNIVFNAKFDCLGDDGLPKDYTNGSLNRISAKGNGDNTTCAVPGTFSGVFDGDGYGVYNCYMRSTKPLGFFETITGTVKNLNFYGGFILITQGGNLGSIAASLAGGNLENCYSSVNIWAKGGPVGGLVGAITANSTITGCTYAGAINATSLTGTAQVGGIIARAESDFTIKNTKNTATIQTACNRVGGIVAMLVTNTKETVIEKCANYGTVTTTSTASSQGGVAGVFGYLHSGTGSVRIANCANFGDITSNGAFAAGISCIGGATHAFSNCANYGNIKGSGASGITPTIRSYSKGFYSSGTVTNLSSDKSGILFGNVWGSNGNNLDYCVAVGTGDAYQEKNSTNTGTPVVYAPGAVELTDGTAINLLNTNNDGVWVQGTNAPELVAFYVAPAAPEVTIDGASLTIGNSVTLNMFVYKKTLEAAGVSSLQSIHIRDSASENYQGKLVDDKYVFQIKGLTANDFGTTRSYTVQYVTNDNMVVVSKAVKEYSPLQYAINMYGKHPEMKTLDPLLLAIVNYAEAAGATGAKDAFNAKHADADWTKLPAYEDVLAGDTNAAQYTYKTLQTEKGLPALNTTLLDDKLLLHVDLSGCGYTKVSVKIGNVDAVDFTGYASVEFYPTDLYNTIEFTFAKNEGDPVVATWSLMQYLGSFKDGSNAVLAEATAIYLYAVRTFCLVNQTTN